ncbi:hatching enzyme 1.2 [Hyalella azteca]|uniref:Metalloendopeptidase n=1 Tax=Hyalella azteca TaxID=294128 RepID=A0A8B7PPI6_HYAAZ|nr:hatching enzyme 1.2 [Hyalella azteca]
MARGKAHPALLALCFCCVATAVTAAPMGGIPRADGSVLVGDILYSAAQWQSLLARNLNSKERLWPKNNGVVKIPYKISNPDLNVTLLKLGFSAWESETCVQFPKASGKDKEYLDISIGDGCYSLVGYIKNDVTTVSISGEACDLKGVTHELGHSMGLEHEQSRSDRDDHITVIWDNIMPGDEIQFVKENTINFGVPYDYSSLMQYQAGAGAKDGMRAMLTKDARFQEIIGNTEGISHMNLLLVNTMYNCIGDWLAACSKKSEPCKNFGYTKKDCSCACPLGTSGKNCENLDMSYNDALVKKIAPIYSI